MKMNRNFLNKILNVLYKVKVFKFDINFSKLEYLYGFIYQEAVCVFNS